MIYILLFILANILFFVGSWMDYKSSLRHTAYGLMEADIFKINRDKYGYFAPKKFLIAHAVYWAVPTTVCLILYFNASGWDADLILLIFSFLLYLPAGGGSVYLALRNNKRAKHSRANQTMILERLSRIKVYDYEQAAAAFVDQNFWKVRVSGRIRAVSFPWLYMDGGSDLQFQEAFFRAIWEISQKDKGAWFSDTRMRPLN